MGYFIDEKCSPDVSLAHLNSELAAVHRHADESRSMHGRHNEKRAWMYRGTKLAPDPVRESIDVDVSYARVTLEGLEAFEREVSHVHQPEFLARLQAEIRTWRQRHEDHAARLRDYLAGSDTGINTNVDTTKENA